MSTPTFKGWTLDTGWAAIPRPDGGTIDIIDAAKLIGELKAAASSAAEWLERMQPVYFANEYTSDRDCEKIQQIIDWIDALTAKPSQPT